MERSICWVHWLILWGFYCIFLCLKSCGRWVSFCMVHNLFAGFIGHPLEMTYFRMVLLFSFSLFENLQEMGIFCRLLPASKRPVNRYKMLLKEVFSKSLGDPPKNRLIVKLCEYSARNPFQIPKITKYIEARCNKDLQRGQIKYIHTVMEVYNGLLRICKGQIAFFAASLLNVATKLLDNSKPDPVRILGFQTLTKFIYSQADRTYTNNIQKLVHILCAVAREAGDEQQKCCLRASSLQCLSAMVWFMAEFSVIFYDIDEIVHVTLDYYQPDTHTEYDEERREPQHNRVDEVVRCEGSGGPIVGTDTSPGSMIRPQPEKKDPTLLEREEIETPEVSAQKCIQRMVKLAEGTTMHSVLNPMFVYFDTGRHRISWQGLALVVLSNICHLVEDTGNQQKILAAVIQHLHHENVAHDPQIKLHVIQVATALVQKIRSITAVLSRIVFVDDLCWHLRKSLEATFESVGGQESSLNISLQNSIKDCLLEIAKKIGDAGPLFDIMAMTLEKLPLIGVVVRATIGSLLVLAHMISLACVSFPPQQVFPEAPLVQLLRVMLHPDIEARLGAHQIFYILVIPSSDHLRHEVTSLRSGYLYGQRRRHSDCTSPLASVIAQAAQLEKSFIVDRTNGSTSLAKEPYILKFSEDQIDLLLAAFWKQANLSDNVPLIYPAIANSFNLTLVSARLRTLNNSLVVRFFQLPLSLRKIALGPNNGMLSPACQRSIFILSTGMLMFAANICDIPELSDLLKPSVPHTVDPYLGILDDRVFGKVKGQMAEYGSSRDNFEATLTLTWLQRKQYDSDKNIVDILGQSLSSITELEADDMAKQLSKPFKHDNAFIFDRDFLYHLPSNSSVEDDTTSESSIAEPTSSTSHIAGIEQLLISANDLADQLDGTSVSTSPLPYSCVVGHCEAHNYRLHQLVIHENH